MDTTPVVISWALSLLSAFISGYALGKANATVDVIEVPPGQPPPRGYRPLPVRQTLYGPAPSAARIGMARAPTGPIMHAIRLHESCDWEAVTEGCEMPDGSLQARLVYVAGHWEQTVIVDRGKWCRVDSVFERGTP